MNTGTANQPFRFTHISDLHLTNPKAALKSLWMICNKRVLGYLSWQYRRRFLHSPSVLETVARAACSDGDHLVITGDLTQIGLPEEYRQTCQWLSRLGSPANISVIPGNHDAYAGSSWRECIQSWKPHMSDRMPEQQDQPLWPFVRLRGPVAFIGVSSAVPSPPFFASGRVGQDQLQRLEQMLADHQSRFRVLLIHHSPVAGHDSFRKRLFQRSSLVRILQARGVEMVLHGHNHRPCWNELKTASGYIPVIGVPAASAAESGPDEASLSRRGSYYAYQVAQTDEGWCLEVTAHRLNAEGTAMDLVWCRRYGRLPALSINSWIISQSARLSTSTAAS